MRLFGREFKFGNLPLIRKWNSFTSVSSNQSGGWWNIILESFQGAWQANIVVDSPKNLMANSGIYACITLIAEDIAKNRIKLLQYDDDNFADEVPIGSAWNPVLRKPNKYQTRIQFLSQWIFQKLAHGNAYILKVRDKRRIVKELHVLDATRITVLISPEGDVFYQCGRDDLTGVKEQGIIPAEEIIHDRMTCLFHPLIGVAPIYAAGWAATMGNKIVSNSAQFFANLSRPSGILTAPGHIAQETADRIKTAWQTNYGGQNVGKIAVMGDGLEFKEMSVPAEQAQLVEQLKWTIMDIARCFHVPEFKVGGTIPAGATIETLNQIYYNDCLQSLIENLELCLDEGLELPFYLGVQLDLDNLLRMDSGARSKQVTDEAKGAIRTIDEARAILGLRPILGGDTAYMQQQNFSLAALAKRDALPDPFAKTSTPAALPAPSQGSDMDDEDMPVSEDDAKALSEFMDYIKKGIACEAD